MPCISVSIAGIKRNPNRVFNKLDGTQWSYYNPTTPSASDWVQLQQPIPIDITVNVSILARFQSDIDQIVANFIPYCDPYFVLSWKWPEIFKARDFEIRSIVRWGENINIQYPQDLSKEGNYWTNADTTFTIEGWMFKNKPPEGKPIHTIDMSFTSVDEIKTYSEMKLLEDEFNTEEFMISARPQLLNISPYFTYMNRTIPEDKSFTVYGKMLDYTKNVYLSSSDWSMFNYTTTGDFITSGPQTINCLNTAYAAFTAIELKETNWDNASETQLELTFTPQTTGVFDIIYMNEAGYGILTNDCIRPTLNPFLSGTTEYNEYIEWQPSCISGVFIR